MIELPEAVTLARQMTEMLRGKRVVACEAGRSPHKFAFFGALGDEYESTFTGRAIGDSEARGSFIVTDVDPGFVLILGCGGERITYHANGAGLPAKRQLLLTFSDASALTVTVQGWGFVDLLPCSDLPGRQHLPPPGAVTPLSDEFTRHWFAALFDDPGVGSRPVKYFLISKPGICGLGNGWCQDILYRAGLHPKRRVGGLTEKERDRLYEAVRDTIRRGTEMGGRDSERDLLGVPGRYRRILCADTVGTPCPTCETPIQKIAFLGGACYVCPRCQPL